MFEELKRLSYESENLDIATLFDTGDRAAEFAAEFDGMRFDYSRTRITCAARRALLALAEERDVAGAREAMFTGAPINRTEGRAVLHTALRNLSGDPVRVAGQDVMPGIRDVLGRMEAFAAAVRGGQVQGAGGPFTDVVNVGIGGSDLGPRMAVRALRPYHDGPRCHFIANVDAADAADTLAGLDPARTLVIVASKTFTTAETMTNAATVRRWMEAGSGDPARQFAAVSTAIERTTAFGIPEARVFGFGEWIGGRYSVWGPVGLPLMIAIGPARFSDFLRGAEAMDRHFRTAPPAANLPVLLALVGVWHAQIRGHATRAVLPYDQRLEWLPAYLQQLEMESNGKGVAMDGRALDGPSVPVVWGAPGTNGQHAFYQAIHQGTQVVPCEFMVAASGHEADGADHHRQLLANCLAQAQALMRGRSLEVARALMRAAGYDGEDCEYQARHRGFPGNRPSTLLLYDRLTPRRLGQILALYEHRVFSEGVILGLNSFDQWGVELGKDLARTLEPVLSGRADDTQQDPATRAALAHLARLGTG